MTCPICFDDIEKEEQVLLKCGHKFHSECFQEWIKNSLTCPYCRSQLKIITNLFENTKNSVNYEYKKKTKCKNVILDGEIIYDSYQQLINRCPIGFLEYNNSIEPIYKLNDKYISYYLRQIILWNKIDHESIYTYTTDCGHKIYHSSQEICKNLNISTLLIMYNWIYELMVDLSQTYLFSYTVDINTILLDLCINNIKKQQLSVSKFQTCIIVSVYIILNEQKIYNHPTCKLTIDKLIDYTDNSSLREDFMKMLNFQSNYVKKNIKIL